MIDTQMQRPSLDYGNGIDALAMAIAPVCEALEARQMLSTVPAPGITFKDGIVTVIGTADNDIIQVNVLRGGLNNLEVKFNQIRRVYNISVISKFVLHGGEGNDRIGVDDTFKKMTVPVLATGGNGNDTIVGASGDDTLAGGNGKDLLIGNAGNDILRGGAFGDRLIGGKGADVLYGESGPDIIASGLDAGDKVWGGTGKNTIDRSLAIQQRPNIALGNTRVARPAAFNGTVVGLTPAQVNKAYGLDQLLTGKFSSVFGDPNGGIDLGTNQTITIIGAFRAPTLQADLDLFSDTFALPRTTLEIVNAQGVPAINAGWAAELALDVQWAHAIAPNANIRVVLAETDLTSDLLSGDPNNPNQTPAIDVATNLARAGGVISMSFGSDELITDLNLQTKFNNANTPMISFLASAGDDAGLISHPGVDPSVLSVGGTRLSVEDDGTYIGESAWSDGGGGISSFFERPIYQTGVTIGGVAIGDNRVVPDVSILADPASGVAVFNTTPDVFNDTGWSAIGGTSAGTPMWAALVTLANQLRLAFDSDYIGQDLNRTIYSIGKINPEDNFNDIVTGANANPAIPGFDLATGWGTPKAQELIPSLSGFLSGEMIVRANFTHQANFPTPDRAIINFAGPGSLTLDKTSVTLNLALTQDNGGSALLLIDNPLLRRGKTGFAGTATALVALDSGGAALFNLIIKGRVFRTSKGVPFAVGEFYSVGDDGKILDRSFNPIFNGSFKLA